MNTKSFVINVAHLHDPLTGPEMFTSGSVRAPVTLRVKTLSAYAVDHAFLIQNGNHILVDGKRIRLDEDNVTVDDDGLCKIIDNEDVLILHIYYYGIRKYEKLFPDVLAKSKDTAERLGKYYSEAEMCFETGAWLSFALMAGAIFEHMLAHKLGMEDTLHNLTREAINRNIINSDQGDIINIIRNYRNLIHAGRINEKYIERADAMDARKLVDHLIINL